MEKQNKIIEIKNIIDKIFNYNKSLPNFNVIRLKKKWNIIIGNQLNNHTEPIKIYNNILYVYCDHQGWINSMQFYKKEILQNIKEHSNNDLNIKDIKFVLKKFN